MGGEREYGRRERGGKREEREWWRERAVISNRPTALSTVKDMHSTVYANATKHTDSQTSPPLFRASKCSHR